MKAILLSAVLILAALTGCSTWAGAGQSPDGKISVVCTIFPGYDWTMEILGGNADKFDVSFLLDTGVDMHSYRPSAEALAKISSCDLFIYVGGKSDRWADAALGQAVNTDMIVINLSELLGGHDHDEHVWLSLGNAAMFSSAIAQALASLDADNAVAFRDNLSAYTARLTALDEQYRTAIDTSPGNTLLFADRFPFRYLIDDYGLNHYAAFPGCTAQAEVCFSTIVFLAGKVDKLCLNAVLVTESGNQAIARTVIDNANGNPQILVLDSMQTITAADVQGGVSYISIIEGNLGVLKQALGEAVCAS
jgi:zinc transport system substrate-binding protein